MSARNTRFGRVKGPRAYCSNNCIGWLPPRRRGTRDLVVRPTSNYEEPGLNAERTPPITSVDDLSGQVVGVQVGNTSGVLARGLKARGAIAGIEYYPYNGIVDVLAGLSAGRIGAVMKLLPVATWAGPGSPGTVRRARDPDPRTPGHRVRPGNEPLRDAVNGWLR